MPRRAPPRHQVIAMATVALCVALSLPAATKHAGAGPLPNGDVNCDGSVTMVDAALVLQLTARLVDSLACEDNADVSDDGRIGSPDALLIAQYEAGLQDTLPVRPPDVSPEATPNPAATPAAAANPTPTPGLPASSTFQPPPTATPTSVATQPGPSTPTRTPTPTHTPTPTPPSSPSGFVTANGTQFWLDGEPYTFIGANFYGAASNPGVYYCGGISSQHAAQLDDTFAEMEAAHIDVVRFWAFQAYTQGAVDFTGIDRVLQAARNHGIRVIPVLENQWVSCSSQTGTVGIFKSPQWYAGGYLSPYSGYPLSFKDYTQEIVTRYENDSTILMWQLMNEAESSDPEALYGFAEDMSAYVQSLDQNHLVSMGTMGGGQQGTQGTDFRELHEIDSIDVVEAHDYNRPLEAMPGYPSSQYNTTWSALQDSKAINKPFFIGEAGIEAGGSGCVTKTQRADLFAAKLEAAFQNGVSGYLIWHFGVWGDQPGCSWDFTPEDPLVAELALY